MTMTRCRQYQLLRPSVTHTPDEANDSVRNKPGIKNEVHAEVLLD